MHMNFRFCFLSRAVVLHIYIKFGATKPILSTQIAFYEIQYGHVHHLGFVGEFVGHCKKQCKKFVVIAV